MNSILRLIGVDMSALKRRAIWLTGGFIAAIIFITLTFAFLGVAFYLTLAEQMTPLSSALVVAGTAFGLCLLTILVTMLSTRGAKNDFSAAVRTSTVAAISPSMVKLAVRHTGVVGAVAVIVAMLAYMEGRRK